MIKIFLLRIFETYFRHRWLYLMPLVLMAIYGGVFIATSEPKYVARAVLYVQTPTYLSSVAAQDNQSAWWMSPAQATTNEMRELLQTNAFIRALIQRTDLEDQMDGGKHVVDMLIEETRENIGVQILGENQVMIGGANKDPKIALQFPNAMLESYIQWQINSQRAQSVAAQAFFRDLIDQYGIELEAARQELRDYLEMHPSPQRGERPVDEQMEIGIIQSKISQLEDREENAKNNEENARLSLAQLESSARQSYSLIDAPVLPEKPETSRRELTMTLAIILGVGMIISVVGIVVAALLDRSFRFPFDVQQTIHLPVLALIPDINRRPSWYERFWARLSKRNRLLESAKETPEVQANPEEQQAEEAVQVILEATMPNPQN
jgi:uncharacterized protein involved in exopolysaccharide biosynthesis